MAARNTPPINPRPLVGRNEVRSALSEALSSAQAGRGSLFVLTGDEGVGKSTILAFATDFARAQGFRVGTARAAPTEVPRPFATVQELLQGFRDPNGNGGNSGSETEEAFSLLLAPLEHREGSGVAPGNESSAPAAGGTETRHLLSALAELPRRNDQSRFLLIDRLIEDLTTLADQKPVFLGIDDFPFVDESSLEFVTELQRHVEKHRIVLALTSDPVPGVRPRPRRFLEAVRHLPSTRWVAARPLTAPETRELLDWLRSGEPTSSDDALRWHQRSKGNPLALEQLLRGTPLAALVTTSPEGGPAPTEVTDRGRALTLPPDTHRVLCYAAVMGNAFDFETLAHAIGQESDEISSAVEGLIREGLVRESRPGNFEFIRESIRQEVYAGLTESRRRILHRKIARALEAGALGDSGGVFELARHLYLGRDWARALEYCRKAAEISAASYAFLEAKLHLERALECARNLPDLDPLVAFRVETELGQVLVEAGELHPAIDRLTDATSRARGDPRLASELPITMLWAAYAHSHLWEHTPARKLASEALELFQKGSNLTGSAIAERVLGSADWDAGNFERAEQHHREAARLAHEAGDTRVEAHAFIDLANVLLYIGPERADEALALYDRAAGLFQSSSDHASLARVRMNRSILLHNMGRAEEALREISQAEEHAVASGSLLWRVYTLLNEAVFRAEAGETTRVRLLIERARELNLRLRDRLSDEQITMIDGMVLENEEDLARARDRYLEALRLVEELEMVPDVLEVRYRIARLAVRSEEWEEARRQIQAAFDAHVEKIRGDLFPKLTDLWKRLPADPALRRLAGKGRQGAPAAKRPRHRSVGAPPAPPS